MKDIDALFADCKFPVLESPYDDALTDAVRYILKKFYVEGILVTGSVIRGNHSKSSDLDIFVINSRPERQRIQKLFNGVPAEIFVNPPNQIKNYFADCYKTGKADTAHMFASGFIILDVNQIIYKLRNKGREIISGHPNPSEVHLKQLRYQVADCYENATDLLGHDHSTAIMLMTQAVSLAMQYRFWSENKWLPRHKDLLKDLENLDPALAELGRDFFNEVSHEQRFKTAMEIMDYTIKTHGFFEWESNVETVKSE
jgi:predicted nucleotidyltransferase